MEQYIRALQTDRKFLLYNILVGIILLIAFLGPYVIPFDPFEANMKEPLLEPSLHHWLGTDKLGRDTFNRIIYGAQYSLSGALILVAIVFVVGSLLGIIAGFYGGKIDAVIMRISDIMISFPGMILAIAVAGIMGGSLINAVLAVAIVTWTKYARLVRSLVLQVKKKDFVDAAMVNGGKKWTIIWRHIAPNVISIAVVTAVADIGSLLMELAGLSFLGFGTQAPTPEWGVMLNEGRQFIQTSPWLMLFPGLAIFITVVMFNLWGDALRDVLDPKYDNH